ncbi:MAG: restriction endonuclease subunit S [Methylotenera sp.]
MGLKNFTIPQNILSTSKHCRLDPKYASFTHVNNWLVFDSKHPQIKLSDLIEELPIIKLKKGDLDEECLLVNISDQDQRSGDIEGVELVNNIGSDKTDLSQSDIFVSKLGMPKGYIFLNSYKGQKLIGSTEFIPYRIKNIDTKLIIKYFLLHEKTLNAYSNLESGKTPSHRRVNPYEFLKIKIPLIPKPALKILAAEILPIEKNIQDLKKQILSPLVIINTIFAREFNYDKNSYNEFGKGMSATTQDSQSRSLKIFETNFSELSKSGITRFSTRFHNPPTKKLMLLLENIDTLQVKDVLIESIHRGTSPNYNPDGEIPVVKTGHLKNGYIEISNEEFVDDNFYVSSTRSQIRKGDILIASTGKGSLGKIDLLDDEQNLVADGHVSIIRLNGKKYNRLFFTYYFRSILGIFQIERDFTGATNQIELYADEIANFRIPDITLKEQQKIVDEIKTELDKQDLVRQSIRIERNKIDSVLNDAFCS